MESRKEVLRWMHREEPGKWVGGVFHLPWGKGKMLASSQTLVEGVWLSKPAFPFHVLIPW